MSYCRLSDADIYLYEDNEGVVCFGKNGHQAYGMTKKEAIEHVREHRRQGDYVPDYVDTILQSEYIDELELQLAEARARLAGYEVGLDPKVTLPKYKEYVLVREVRGDQPIYWDVQYLGKDLWVNWAFNDPSKDADIKRWYPLPESPSAPEVEE